MHSAGTVQDEPSLSWALFLYQSRALFFDPNREEARRYDGKSTAEGAASPASATIFDSIPDAFGFGYLMDALGRLPPNAREDKQRERSTKPDLPTRA